MIIQQQEQAVGHILQSLITSLGPLPAFPDADKTSPIVLDKLIADLKPRLTASEMPGVEELLKNAQDWDPEADLDS